MSLEVKPFILTINSPYGKHELRITDKNDWVLIDTILTRIKIKAELSFKNCKKKQESISNE